MSPGMEQGVGTTLRLSRLALSALLLVGCDDAVAPDVSELRIEPVAGLIVGLPGTDRFSLMAFDEAGVSVATDGAVWSVADESVATVHVTGTARGVGPGTTTVTARLGGRSATASLEVYVPQEVGRYEPGQSYAGRGSYTEYLPGELPVAISAPHGGDVRPDEIADRGSGVTVADSNTRELALAVRDALVSLTGFAPHVIISHLHRSKLDPNREVVEAAQGNRFAEQAWAEYHGFIESARREIDLAGGGVYFDLHGHGHPEDRLELGYLLTGDQLNQPDASLEGVTVIRMTSIREMGRVSPLPFPELLRGATSLGGLLESEGIRSVPSPAEPSPGSDPYFSGGYSTRRHGSIGDGEIVSAIQIEHHYAGIRDNAANRAVYAAALARVIRAYMLEHFGYFEP